MSWKTINLAFARRTINNALMIESCEKLVEIPTHGAK